MIKYFPERNSFSFWGLLMVLATVSFFAVTGDALAQNAFEKGRRFFELRATDADSFRAEPENINKAIEALEEAIDNGINPEESAIYLLRSYYFKGMFTGQPESQKKEIYEKGRSLGERMIERFPKSVPIKFWYGANMGRWAKVHGFVKAATSGIAQKLREVSNDIIKLDPEYQGGGGYRILAQVHFYSPSIPLLMGWPSDQKAMELVKKALEIAPDHLTNRMLHAELLLEFGRDAEAKNELQKILEMDIRPEYKVEDRFVKHRCRELLKENF